MPNKLTYTPQLRVWWRGLWGGEPSLGAGGEAAGTNGRLNLPLARSFVLIAAFVTLVDVVNVLTTLHDAARRGQALAVWQLITSEATSGAAELLACPLIYAAVRLAPMGRRPWGLTLVIHGAATLVFSALHVTLMMMMRIAVYASLGLQYRVEAGAAPYEYRKDVIAYLVFAGTFHIFFSRRAPGSLPPDAPSQEVIKTFDITEGARTLRVSVHEILAVRAAGNYVEFQLENGLRPLMRTTLQDLEEQLGAVVFVRTHRSWLINALRVRALEPTGSGDYAIVLDKEITAPLSRRFPQALDRLRKADEGPTSANSRLYAPSKKATSAGQPG